jgi:hypothetical protein
MLDCPIIINNFNRVTTTKRMVTDLLARDYSNIIILDNNSSYPPLLRWYEEVKDKVRIEMMGQNFMQNAIFDYQSGAFLQSFQGKRDWIAYTDSDLTLHPYLPNDFISSLVKYATQYGYKKAGLALYIHDLPNTDWGNTNREWETKFWEDELAPGIYKAQIDTTFSIWNPCTHIMFDAIRVGGNFTARHEPWYTDFSRLDEEERFFLEHAHEYSTYKRYYQEHYK